MPVLDMPRVQRIEDDATKLSVGEVAEYLQAQVGQRVAASLAGLSDPKQIGRYIRSDGPRPHNAGEIRLREGYKVVRTLVEAYDGRTARAWLFGTNSRLDDRAPIELLREATEAAHFRPVLQAARQLATFQE